MQCCGCVVFEAVISVFAHYPPNVSKVVRILCSIIYGDDPHGLTLFISRAASIMHGIYFKSENELNHFCFRDDREDNSRD